MVMKEVYKSRVVHIGRLSIGGTEDVRIQSMTNTPTMETKSTFRQIIELQEAGCELIRLTARNIREAENLGVIRNMLENEGVFIPLAADIHFNPNVAERAATIVHKIRINPGNYLDQQYFLSLGKKQKLPDTDPEVVRDGIIRLTNICRKHNTVIRVGVNHGSLSERILRKYGNTAEGMVASAMEFLEICQETGFNDLVVSMKSSHVPTMVKASLGTVEAMMQKGMDYPVHLGVTEAGEGEDGRIRSAAGIGPLLEQGIGDTIRVSLTEDPVAEIPEAKKLVEIYSNSRRSINDMHDPDPSVPYHNINTNETGIIGRDNPPLVIGNPDETNDPARKPDLIPLAEDTLRDQAGREYRMQRFSDPERLTTFLDTVPEDDFDHVFLFTGISGNLKPVRKMFDVLGKKKCTVPVLVKLEYSENDSESLLLSSASDFSSLMLNSYGNGYWLENKLDNNSTQPELVFGILQATGIRISGTEYISCPTCGRTSFDVQGTMKKIRGTVS